MLTNRSFIFVDIQFWSFSETVSVRATRLVSGENTKTIVIGVIVNFLLVAIID